MEKAAASTRFLLLLLPLAALPAAAAPRATTWGPIAFASPQLLPCDALSIGQRWRLRMLNGSAFQIVANLSAGVSNCLVASPVWVAGANVTVVNQWCDAAAPEQAFQWRGSALATTSAQTNLPPGPQTLCLSLVGGGLGSGTQAWLEPCVDGAAPAQSWVWTTDRAPSVESGIAMVPAFSGTLSPAAAPGMCLDVGTAWKPCSAAPFDAMPLCDAALPLSSRLDDALARMTSHEKVQQLASNSPGAPSIGLPPWYICDVTHSASEPMSWSYDMPSHGVTVYPSPHSLAQSFDAALWLRVADAIGNESRALYNAGFNSLVAYSPNINLIRDPRWGRANEVPGEDPLLAGRYAVAFVTGVQWGAAAGVPADTDGVPIKIATNCKHLAAYSLELWNGTIRYEFDAVVSRQDLFSSYLPHFQACVQEAKTSGLMCSYNEVSGVPACAAGELMNEIARGAWGFQGSITSDNGASRAVWMTYAYVATAEESCPATLNAGMDYGTRGDGLPLQCAAQAVADGTLDAAVLEQAVRRVLSVRFRAGHFDAETPFDALDSDELVCSPVALALAQTAAERGLVLLKVDRARLPLSRAVVRSVAAVGPGANATQQLLGDYSGYPCGGRVESVAEALAAANLSVVFAFGCATNSTDASGIAAAAAAAAAADATVIVAGLDLTVEREGLDRYEIGWPGVQAQLVAQTCAAARGPCVLVLVGAGSVDLSEQLADANVSAILAVAYPGIRGAAAIVRALFGDASPAGRLTKTIYPAGYVDEVSMFDMSMPPVTSPWPCCLGSACGSGPCQTPGRTYRFLPEARAVLPFGFGLSYSLFTYSLGGPVRVELGAARRFLAANTHPRFGAAFAPRHAAPAAAVFFVNVSNIGVLDTDDVVLGFLRPPPGAGIPQKFLFGFARVAVAAGTQASVQLTVSAHDLTQVLASGERVAWPGEYTIEVGLRGAQQAGAGFASAVFEAK